MITQGLVPLTEISRWDAYRQTWKGTPELAASIRESGLMCPVILTDKYQLVSGSRRLMAAYYNRDDAIQALVIDNLAEIFDALEEEKAKTAAADNAYTLALNPVEKVYLQRILTDLRPGRKNPGFKLADRIAAYLDTSTNTMWRATYVVDAAEKVSATPETVGIMLEMADTGNVTRAYEKVRNPEAGLLTNRVQPTIEDLKTQRIVLQGAAAKVFGLTSVLPQIKSIHPRMPQEEREQFMADLADGRRVLDKMIKILGKAQA